MTTYVVLKLTGLSDQYETDADRRILFVSQDEERCLEVIEENLKVDKFFDWELYECDEYKVMQIASRAWEIEKRSQTEED